MQRYPLKITYLQEAKDNTKEFAKLLKEDKAYQNPFAGQPKSTRWLNAICQFHKPNRTGYGLEEAIERLQESFSSRQKTPQNNKEIKALTNALNKHINNCKINKYEYVDSRHSISKSSKLAKLTQSLELVGWIYWLLYQTLDSKLIGLIIRNPEDIIEWKSELRYPIMQYYIKEQYNLVFKNVEVGVIDYTTGTMEFMSYTNEEIQNAYDMLKVISEEITAILKIP